MNEGIGYPGSAWRPGQSFSTGVQKQLLQTSPSAVEVYWWRSRPDPSFNAKTGSFGKNFGDAGSTGGQWIRELQGTKTAIISDERILRRYFQMGTWETGDIAIGFDPQEFDLTEHDWIVQKGSGRENNFESGSANCYSCFNNGEASQIDVRTFTQKEIIVRGEGSVRGAGVITVNGTSVTGTGTAFKDFFRPGSVLKTVTGFKARVVSVASHTALTLDASPGASVLAQMLYDKGVDRLRYGPVAALRLVQDEERAYEPGSDVRVSMSLTDPIATGDQEHEEGLIEWLSAVNSPAPGTRYGVNYAYVARYVVTDLGTKGAVVAGVPMLSLHVGRLWKPDRSSV